MRIVHLASGLGPTASARHLSLLAPALAERGEEQLLLNLGADEPFGRDLRAVGIPLRTLRFRNWFDLAHAKDLRRAVASFRPDVVHVWGNRAAILANWLYLPRVLNSNAPLVVSNVRAARGWSEKLLNRTKGRAKLTQDSRPVLPLAGGRPITASDVGIPTDARIILNVGGFDTRSDSLTAAAAFDIFKHTVKDAHLLMAGDGPTRRHIEEIAIRVGHDDYRTHFVGLRNDIPALLSMSSVVLVTHRHGGAMIAREALASRKPVIAWDTPEMVSLIADGENGILVPIGDRTRLSSALYRILTEPVLAAKMTAGSGKSSDTISLAAAAQEWQALYRSVAR